MKRNGKANGKANGGANRKANGGGAPKIKHWDNFLAGAANALNIAPRRDYIIPDRNGFARDAAALRGDFCRVAEDMNKSIYAAERKYGKDR